MPLNKNMKFKNRNSGVLDYPSNKKAKLLVYGVAARFLAWMEIERASIVTF